MLVCKFLNQFKVKELANELIAKQNSFVKYIIDKTPCTFSRFGNQASKSNHSSIFAHIGFDYIMELENILL